MEREDLQNQIEELQELLDKQVAINKENSRAIEGLRKELNAHSHLGADGTSEIRRTVTIPAGEGFVVGNAALEDASNQTNKVGALVVGPSTTPGTVLNSPNSQVELTHGGTGLSDAAANLSFFRGLRPPLYSFNDGQITSGESVMTQSKFTFSDDELVGSFPTYLSVYNPDSATDFDSFRITANDSKTITIDGTFAFSGNKIGWIIFKPVFLGSADFPWQRAYVMEGSEGGLRFGPGATAGGQNAILYIDSSSGFLIFRDQGGNTYQLAP